MIVPLSLFLDFTGLKTPDWRRVVTIVALVKALGMLYLNVSKEMKGDAR